MFAEYPAHMHIDLLPRLQGQGLGRALIETLADALRERGVPGLHLGVSTENPGAIAFYHRVGFVTLEELVLGARPRARARLSDDGPPPRGHGPSAS